ncbi:MAG TPA: hypothetical protein VHA12_01700 [Candidatus Nanoarchaeia archaeon]|nr:hypothetical protein [Candidatus Nanoarchaeia archaeon]
MNKLTKLAITVIFLVVLIGGFYLMSSWISSATGYVIKSDDPDLLSKCFSEKNVIMYTSLNCPECTRQKQEFSEIMQGLNVVDCAQNPRECLVLSKLPALEYEKSLYYGFKSIDEAREIVNC